MAVKMETTKRACKGMEAKLADMLLDPEAVSEKAKAHVAECAHCAAELKELRAAMTLMDEWEAPEPSPYFLTRLEAQMREEREAAPRGWLARLRDRFAYGPQMHTRPLAAMALTIMLLLGGGAYLTVTDWMRPSPPLSTAAMVIDLENLNSNEALLDQLETISEQSDNGD